MCSSSPEEFLSLTKKIEWDAGRRPGRRLAARPLDIDLLIWGNRIIDTPELIIPHLRLRTRRFVLEPLAEVVPDLAVPPDGAVVRDLLKSLGDQQKVRRVAWTVEPI